MLKKMIAALLVCTACGGTAPPSAKERIARDWNIVIKDRNDGVLVEGELKFDRDPSDLLYGKASVWSPDRTSIAPTERGNVVGFATDAYGSPNFYIRILPGVRAGTNSGFQEFMCEGGVDEDDKLSGFCDGSGMVAFPLEGTLSP